MKIDNRIVFGVIAGAAVGLFFLGRSCGVKSVLVKAGRIDTIFARPDTFRTLVTKEVLKPVKVIRWIPQGVLVDTVVQPVDSLAILEAFNSTYLYSYSERFKRGSVQIDDTISQNMFLGRGVTFILDSIPISIRKDTLIINEAKKILLYGSASFGTSPNLVPCVGVGLHLKLPNEKIYGVGLKRFGGSWIYEGQVLIPLRLKKL